LHWGAVAGCARLFLFAVTTKHEEFPAARAGIAGLGFCNACLSGASSLRGAIMLGRIPAAARNIYGPSRFKWRALSETSDGPAAVNDIGAVSWMGDQFVVDLWGLANPDVFDCAAQKNIMGPR